MTDKNRVEDPEFGLDSRYTSDEERASEAAMLMEARLKRMKNLSKDQVIRAKLMQLKLQMEESLNHERNENINRFADFLKSYVDIIYTTRKQFARDIGIAPTNLSQVINKHRDPKDEFIKKLMIHSQRVYGNVANFQDEIWFKIYFQQKMSERMANESSWRPMLEKKVQVSEPILKDL